MTLRHLIPLTITLGFALSLAACADSYSDTATSTSSIEKTTMSPQIITVTSSTSFNATVSKLREAIAKRPLKLFAEIDHAKGAASIDLSLEPSTLFIFGNPKGGTPLMTRNPQMGIVLPLKMHVYQKDGTVFVTYPDIKAVAETYGLDSNAQPVPNIAAMLSGLADDVTG